MDQSNAAVGHYPASPTARLICGDVRDVLPTLPAESVQCVVTSPPYWRLRSYLPDDHPRKSDELGSEPTPAAFVANLVAVMREVRRVLRCDGVVWLNIADTYAGGSRGGNPGKSPHIKQATNKGSVRGRWDQAHGIKAKNLCLIPQRLVIALQDDGWYVRSEIVWAKTNAMPQSATDRPTSAHEMIYLLSTSPQYYYDAEAVRTPAKTTALYPEPTGWDTGEGGHGSIHRNGRERRDKQRGHSRVHAGFNARWDDMSRVEQQAMGANLRTVWNIATQGFSGAHYATFPEAIAEICLSAGASLRGCCPECGAPWRRLVDIDYSNPGNRSTNGPRSSERKHITTGGYETRLERQSRTIGWSPTCSCDAGDPVPCTVLDPFAGAGTVALVAARLGMHSIGIDLDERNIDIARNRIHGDAPLLNRVVVEGQNAEVPA